MPSTGLACRYRISSSPDLDRGQPRQDIGQVSLRVQASSPSTDQHRVNYRTAPPHLGMADKQPSLATYRGGANVILNQVIVDLEASVLEISEQSIVFVKDASCRRLSGYLIPRPSSRNL